MEIAIVTEGIGQKQLDYQPFYRFREQLGIEGFRIRVFRATEPESFRRPFDAMIMYVWQDWQNRRRFDRNLAMTTMENFAIYRSAFPETRQIILNHTDMSRRPYATPFWRAGDPVLYRTPAYDRSELYPFPADSIWAYEYVWGSSAYTPTGFCKYKAGFIGKPNGPPGFRRSVARYTRKVGIGKCSEKHKYSQLKHDHLMSHCQIVVCPRGWGEQSKRHWDAWLSGKPVLTDRECDSVEMIPGLRLEHGEHYLVFDEPAQIPELVREWTDPSRRKQLERIGVNGREAARSYDAYGRIRDFFKWVFASR